MLWAAKHRSQKEKEAQHWQFKNSLRFDPDEWGSHFHKWMLKEELVAEENKINKPELWEKGL